MVQAPNLLIIQTDQQADWTLGCYGGRVITTPHIDRLAREGALFRNYFTNSAVCTPSRGCFLTGHYPHCHGAYTNNIELNRDEVTFAQSLKEQGYTTGYAGKWHLDGTPRPGWVHPTRGMGFDDNRLMFNRGHWKKIDEIGTVDMEPRVWPDDEIGDSDTYTTDWLTAKTITWLDTATGPFCFMMSIPDPHMPYTVRAPYDRLVAPADVPMPATFRDNNLPDWAAAERQDKGYLPDDPQAEGRLRRIKAAYYGMAKQIDDCVGRILAHLEQSGQLDNTIVVFTTDHGDYMGEHGFFDKNKLYESVYRIPLVVRWPARIPGGTVINKMTAIIDFHPTILKLMGCSTAGREQGHDVSGWMMGEKTALVEKPVFIHHSSLQRAGICTPAYCLGLVDQGEGILFDRVADPNQTTNLFSSSTHRQTVQDLTVQVVAHHRAFNSPAASWLSTL